MPPASSPLLEVFDLSKTYPDGWSLQSITLDVREQEIVCLLGPSGCGKTTLLRLLAGLERADSGRIVLDGVDVTDAPPHQRGIGMMFQDYALFPHMNVAQNVAFGLRMQRLKPAEIQARMAEALKLVGLGGFERRDVNELSGGEKQRVALARSLAPGPRLLMLDEPLGALDRALRERLMTELRAILKEVKITALYVTHDQAEAFSIADRVVVMNQGWIEQVGAPETLYYQPRNQFVARFLGLTNLLPGELVDHQVVHTPLGDLRTHNAHGLTRGTQVQVLIRPEGINLTSPAETPHNTITARMLGYIFRGGHYRLTVDAGQGLQLTLEAPAGYRPPSPGSSLNLHINPQAITLLGDENTEKP